MKKYLITLFIIIGSVAFAGNPANEKGNTTLVSGKVIDKVSGEEIAGAEVVVDDKTVYTDLNGNFSAIIDINKTNAIVKYVSYLDAKVTIDPFSYNTITIELSSK